MIVISVGAYRLPITKVCTVKQTTFQIFLITLGQGLLLGAADEGEGEPTLVGRNTANLIKYIVKIYSEFTIYLHIQ